VSRENVELVRRFARSWAERDLDAAMDCVHDEIEVDWSDSIGPFPGTYKGRGEVRRFWNQIMEAWDEFRPELVEVLESGPERLITVDRVRARGRQSGVAIESRSAMVWTVKEGRILRMKMFQTKDAALEAVGAADRADGGRT
jgi:ketosteroid isomerase-like protein